MRQLINSILLTVLMSMVGTRASAYDFEVDGIYYTIISFEDFLVEVNGFSPSLSGIVNIPSSITYSNKHFTVCHIARISSGNDLETVIIPSTITTIGDGAFSYTKIEYMYIPDNVTDLGDNSFEKCSRLKSIRLSSNIYMIPHGCFANCTNLEKVEWHPFINGSSIWGNAFANCTSLKTFTIPAGCHATGVCRIKENLVHISFYGCSSLDSLIIEDGLSKKSSIRFGHSMKKINDFSDLYFGEFYNSQFKYLYLGKSFESDFTWARTYLEAEHVVIGDSVEYLSEWPVAIKTLVIGKSLTSVRQFGGESPLEYIKIRSSTPPKAAGFSNKYYMYTVLYVPKGTKAIYESADIWKNFWNIEEFSVEEIPDYLNPGDNPTHSGLCGQSLHYSYTNATQKLTISGSGDMTDYDFDYNKAPWSSYANEIQTVELDPGITSIGNYAFYKCSSLSSVTIPNSLTSIGGAAFYFCTSLNYITIPNSVTVIGDYVFQGCTGLTSVTIGNSVTTIGKTAFYGCSSLTSVTIPNSVTSIGQAAFKYCRSLTSVTIGNSVTSIDSYTFGDCLNLTSVTIGNSVTTIGEGAFSSCNLTTIAFPNSVRFIDKYAFEDCI